MPGLTDLNDGQDSLASSTNTSVLAPPHGSTEFSFLRAIHSFDSHSLAATQSTSSDILSFDDGDLVILHAIHSSGWGDASVLSSGKRGWIPTNYFTAYAEYSMIPLLSAVLSLAQCSSVAIAQDQSNESASNDIANANGIDNGIGPSSTSSTITPATKTVTPNTTASPAKRMSKSPRSALFTSIKNGFGFSRQASKKEKPQVVEAPPAPAPAATIDAVSTPTDSVNDLVRSANIKAYHSVTSIVSGVRSLLENCGALTRDAHIVKSFQTIRRLRKTLLTELAILVSLAKHCKEANRNDVLTMIDKMVLVAYKIVTKAAHFLDIRNELETDKSSRNRSTMSLRSGHQRNVSASGSGSATIDLAAKDASALAATSPTTSPSATPTPSLGNAFEEKPRIKHSKSLPGSRSESISSRTSPSPVPSSFTNPLATPSVEILGIESSASTITSTGTATGNLLPSPMADVPRNVTHVKRGSVYVLSEPPMASARISHVYDALNSSLSVFIHHQTEVLSSGNILVKTRRCMVTCRELLATVDLVNSHVPGSRSKELDKSNDKLFGLIKELVVQARAAASSKQHSPEPYLLAALSDMATDCSETASMCVVMCRSILSKSGDFTLPASREYVDLSQSDVLHHTPDLRHTPDLGYEASSPLSPGLDGPHNELYKQSLFKASEITLQRTPTNTWANANLQLPVDDPEKWIVRDTNGKLRGASLEALVALLTAENVAERRSHYYSNTTSPDQSLLTIFFLTFRLFCTPQELFRLLVKRFAPQVQENQLSFADMEVIALRRVEVYHFIKRWLESHWRKSTDAPVLPSLLQFSSTHFDMYVPNGHLVLQSIANRIAELPDGQALVPRAMVIEDVAWPVKPACPVKSETSSSSAADSSNEKQQHSYSSFQAQIRGMASLSHLGRSAAAESDVESSSAATLTTKSSTRSDHSKSMWKMRQSIFSTIGPFSAADASMAADITAFDARDVAKQLTIIDSTTFCAIEPIELMDQNFARKKRHLNLAPHIVEMTSLSNQLSTFVSDSILMPDISLKTRQKILKHWIKVADRALDLGNFNCVLSIISALQSVKIMRLRNLWEMLPQKNNDRFQALKRLLIPEKNFNAYRSVLKAQPVPNIPYLGLVLSDFIFIEEGNPKNRFADGHQLINLDRYEQLTRRIAEVQACQVPYSLQRNRELQQWLLVKMGKAQQENEKDQNVLWRRSIVVQPK